MSQIQLQELLEAGMHFGHLTRRWNPKMKPFIYGVRNGIHIIDLSKTAKLLQMALSFISQSVSEGRDVLFVGTKKQAQDLVQEEAERCKMFYVNRRWLGGTLTNFRTIKTSINRLKELQKKKDDGTFSVLSKKEQLMIDREIDKLLYSLGGIQNMNKAPGVMVIVDPNLERIALHEANVLGIPVVALADTNCDPDPIEHLVPGNDDALRSIQVFLKSVADQVLEGLQLREINARKAAEQRAADAEAKPSVREVEVTGDKKAAYVSGDKRKPEEAEEVVEGQYHAEAKQEEKKEAASGDTPKSEPAATEESQKEKTSTDAE